METMTNRKESELTKRIMRRVYLIAGIRFALNPSFLKAVIAVVLLVRSMKYVSYVNVLKNMPSFADLGGGYLFVKGALFHAHPMTIILLSSVAWLAVWVAFDIFSKREREVWL